MKKLIFQNDAYIYEAIYIISKKRYASYFTNKRTCFKTLTFLKNKLYHRPCNLGPQYKTKNRAYYRENNKLHNLYGPASIGGIGKEYYIYGKKYNYMQFYQYLSIYNNLSYKRTY